MTKVSVVLPSYNHASCLPKAIDSVFAQTFQDWELLIVDDGSEDGSVSIIEAYVAKYPQRIRFFQHENRKNKGLAATYRLAFEKCRGEYVALLESDDYWREDSLALKAKVLEDHPDVAVVYTDVEMFGDPGLIRKVQNTVKAWDLPYNELSQGPFSGFHFLMDENLVLTCSAFITRKELLVDLNFDAPYDAWFDRWILIQLSMRGCFLWIPQAATFWQVRGTSYLHQFNRQLRLYRESCAFELSLLSLVSDLLGSGLGEETLTVGLTEEIQKRKCTWRVRLLERIFNSSFLQRWPWGLDQALLCHHLLVCVAVLPQKLLKGTAKAG